MKIEDYNKYYIQGSDQYLIPKDVFKELFNEMANWKEESQKQKDNWNKLKEYLKGFDIEYLNEIMEHNLANTLENILDKMQELEQGSDSNE